MLPAWVLLAAFGAQPLPKAEDGLVVVDMVVAEVDASVITLSELMAETRLTMLVKGGVEFARAGAMHLELLRAVLKTAVQRELLIAEARRLQLREVPQQEVDAKVAGIREMFATEGEFLEFLRQAGIDASTREGDTSPSGLADLVRKNLQMSRFIELRILPSAIADSTLIRACFEANKARYEWDSLEDPSVHRVIEVAIRDQLSERTLRTLIDRLKSRATIRYAPAFRPDPESEEERGEYELRCPIPERQEQD